jgi:hypothetical protein
MADTQARISCSAFLAFACVHGNWKPGKRNVRWRSLSKRLVKILLVKVVLWIHEGGTVDTRRWYCGDTLYVL